jgi:ubiquinone biosynthesis monooxygenase Coq7
MPFLKSTIQPLFTDYLERELRSDHAGETGAVYIYQGIAAIARISNDIELINFAKNHGTTEAKHLELMEAVLPPDLQSRLLVLWRIAGWLIGAIPALFGRRAVYATIAAVETFVEQHYQDQIDHLRSEGQDNGLLQLLQRCQADEIDHKEESKSMISGALPLVTRAWCSVVSWGSAAAVVVARRL